MTYLHRLRLILFVCLLAPLAAVAAPSPESGARLIEESFHNAVQALRERRAEVRDNPQEAYQLLNEVLAPNIDFELISRLVLARHWRGASEQQQQRFVEAFRESLLRTYALVLAEHADKAVEHLQEDRKLLEIQAVQEQRKNRITVRTQLLTGGPPVRIDYRLYAADSQWKVYDVLIEGISFITNRRAEVDSALRQHGLDKLIEQLTERNRRLREQKGPA